MRDELPPEIQSLIGRCEVGVIHFNNNQMSEALYFAEKTFQRLNELIFAFQTERVEVEQILGKAMRYPWYKDDQKNFPGATESDGVCVGEHVAVTLAMEAVKEIEKLRADNKQLRECLSDAMRQWASYYGERNADDIETGKHPESSMYRRCESTLKSTIGK